MGNLGRYVCVALPFLLTLASLIALLVGGLAGVVGNKDGLYMFRVNLTELQVKPTTLAGLVGRSPEPVPLPQAAPLISAATSLSVRALGAAPLIAAATGNPGKANAVGNITAADLGLNKIYDVNLWGYCFTPQSGDRSCLQPKFNWAETEVNSTLTNITKIASAVGKNVTMPKEVTDALQTFATVSRWTEIVFIIAAIALGVALVLGLVSNCSRAVSCLTWVVSGIASAAACAFAALATATAVVVVGTAEGTAKFYGVHADFNGNFLATIWIAVAFALAAGFFWIFTICCCKPEHRSRSKRHSDSEKHMPVGGYAPLHDNQQAGGFQNNSSYYHNQYGAPRYPQPVRSDMAYEPYSHARN